MSLHVLKCLPAIMHLLKCTCVVWCVCVCVCVFVCVCVCLCGMFLVNTVCMRRLLVLLMNNSGATRGCYRGPGDLAPRLTQTHLSERKRERGGGRARQRHIESPNAWHKAKA